ncbi:hypothetical protein L602_001100000710 [Cupriavidus gilardii J11]|uniref:SecDF P1 head subdomain domain-containing protein n=1 Tax=Cupriavidus gilardii J11 TaxID=936133 RepID=A0A562BUM5_9BURK|nr:hypothetical protein [Cupriavidus gilardii]TWG88639.1 hypothetical protein L602_001100000710 [Cupriavidus gilardii J11]
MHPAISVAIPLVAIFALGACQQLPVQPCAAPAAMAPAAAPPVPAAPAAPVASVAPVARNATPVPTPVLQQPARRPSVEFRLAQPERAPNLSELRIGNEAIWLLPKPVLTRDDLSTVTAVKAKDGRSYVRFVFTQGGAQKLASLSQRYAGKLFVLSIDGSLAATPRIGNAMNKGVLFVPMASEQQALNVAAVIGGEGRR